MKKIKALILKYWDIVSYLFFGGVTTLVNWGVYALLYNVLGASNMVSTAAAWLLAVAVAFVTNKIWVFKSPSFDAQTMKRELTSFLSARILTGLLDMAIMYISVEQMHMNGNVWKLISNVVVIVLNYVASKLYIFKKRR